MNIQAQFETYRATVLSAYSMNDNIVHPALAYALQERIFPFWHSSSGDPFHDCFKVKKSTVEAILNKIEELVNDDVTNIDRHLFEPDFDTGEFLPVLRYVRLMGDRYEKFFDNYLDTVQAEFPSTYVTIA